MPIPRLNPLMVATMVAALAACSDSGGSSSPEAAAASASAPTQSATPPSGSNKASAAPKGDCDLITHDEVSQAFAGKLTVTRSSGHGGRGGACTYDIAEVDQSQLIVQAGSAESFAMRKESYSSQSGIPMEPLTLGQEAYLVNRAQVIVLTEDGQSLSIGLMMFTIGSEPPVSHVETSIALQAMTLKALDRMR